MKEVSWDKEIPKAEFIFARKFMLMKHNYLCAICKENSAVQNTANGILQPCWDCQSEGYCVVKLSWWKRAIIGTFRGIE